MRTMTMLAAAAVLAVSASAGAPRASVDKPPYKVKNPPFVVPVLHFRAGSPMTVYAEFENRLKKPFRVMSNAEAKPYVGFLLSRDGRLIPPQISDCVSGLPSDVLELVPGQRVEYKQPLDRLYEKLTPGRYRLDVGYSLAPEAAHVANPNYRLTPLKFRYTLMYIIVDPSSILPEEPPKPTVKAEKDQREG